MKFYLRVLILFLFAWCFFVCNSYADQQVFTLSSDPQYVKDNAGIGDIIFNDNKVYEIYEMNNRCLWQYETVRFFQSNDEAFMVVYAPELTTTYTCHVYDADEYDLSEIKKQDADNDGLCDLFDPFPNHAGIDGHVTSIYLEDAEAGKSGVAYIFDDPREPGYQEYVSYTGDAKELMETYSDECYDDNGGYILNHDSSVNLEDNGSITWDQYASSVNSLSDENTSSVNFSDTIDDENYMDYVNETPEPITYDSNIDSDNTEYKKEYTDTDNNGTVTTAYNQYLGDIAANTELANNNYGEMGKYLKSIDSGIRNMEELGYGGPSALEIGEAVGDAVSGSDSNGTSPTAEEIGDAVGESVMGDEEVSEDVEDYLPSDPGHGHGDSSLEDAKGYFETKLDEWFLGFEENSEVNQFFDGTEIVYTGPTSVLSIGPIEIGENTIQEEFDFAAWQTEIAMIGNLLYAFVCIYWGLWVFRRD